MTDDIVIAGASESDDLGAARTTGAVAAVLCHGWRVGSRLRYQGLGPRDRTMTRSAGVRSTRRRSKHAIDLAISASLVRRCRAGTADRHRHFPTCAWCRGRRALLYEFRSDAPGRGDADRAQGGEPWSAFMSRSGRPSDGGAITRPEMSPCRCRCVAGRKCCCAASDTACSAWS